MARVGSRAALAMSSSAVNAVTHAFFAGDGAAGALSSDARAPLFGILSLHALAARHETRWGCKNLYSWKKSLHGYVDCGPKHAGIGSKSSHSHLLGYMFEKI